MDSVNGADVHGRFGCRGPSATVRANRPVRESANAGSGSIASHSRLDYEQSTEKENAREGELRGARFGNIGKRDEIGAMRADPGENRGDDPGGEFENAKLISDINVHRAGCEIGSRNLVHRVRAGIRYEKESAACVGENRVIGQTSDRFAVCPK